MRIVYFTDTFHPMLNGVVTSIDTFSKELADRWHELLIVVPDHTDDIGFAYRNIEVLTVKGFPAFFYPDFKVTFGFTPRLIRKIRAFKPDVIHFHTQFILGWQAIVLGKLLKIPRIGTFHTSIADDGYLRVIGVENFRIFGEIGWKYNNFFYEHCEKVITPSESAKKELSEHGIDAQKIIVLPNPAPEVREQRIENREEKWNSFLSSIVSENVILYIGRISKEKSLSVCLDAIYVISREIPDVLFVVVWDGPDRKEAEEYAEELWISRNVLFLGKIRHEALMSSDIFEKSKFFLTASATETQGITILEAMSFSLPIVWVDAKGVGELIEDNGYKARVGNYGELALYCLKILQNPELREELGARSAELVQKYDVQKLTDELENIYEQVIKNGLRKK